MTEALPLHIQGSELLTGSFDSWPRFHDSEVLELVLKRDPKPTAILRVTAFRTSSELDDAGFYKKINECVVAIEFEDINELRVEDFNEQNVLAEIFFATTSVGFEVLLAGLYGIHASFKCKNVRVLSVTYKT